MRLLGLGNDIVSIDRITRSIEEKGDRFLQRIFTAHEIAFCQNRGNGMMAAFARRFAAKEACSKALGTGIAKGVSWTDIEVQNNADGAPKLVLNGGALKRLEAMMVKGYEAEIALTLADDKPWANAVVLIMAHKKEEN